MQRGKRYSSGGSVGGAAGAPPTELASLTTVGRRPGRHEHDGHEHRA